MSSGSGLCDNLSYSVERLVRGLSSNRDGARQGFTVCLTEVGITSVTECAQLSKGKMIFYFDDDSIFSKISA